MHVITTDGTILQGYQRNTKDNQESGDLVFQNPASNEMIPLAAGRIAEKREMGSPMPASLAALLSRPQLLDMIQHLSELGQIK